MSPPSRFPLILQVLLWREMLVSRAFLDISSRVPSEVASLHGACSERDTPSLELPSCISQTPSRGALLLHTVLKFMNCLFQASHRPRLFRQAHSSRFLPMFLYHWGVILEQIPASLQYNRDQHHLQQHKQQPPSNKQSPKYLGACQLTHN